MKWKNIDRGASYYYITGTITEWLPLLERDYIRKAVIYEINVALRRFHATLIAYVIMPDHLHLLVYLPGDEARKDVSGFRIDEARQVRDIQNPETSGQLHRFLKCWRGRSARRIIDLLIAKGDTEALAILAKHANGGCKYAAWKEQARAFAVYTDPVLQQKADYIHANPVQRGLVEEPGQWPHSSFGFYERGEDVSGFRLDQVWQVG